MSTIKELVKTRRHAFKEIADGIKALQQERERRIFLLGEEKISNNIRYSEAFAVAIHAAAV